MSCIVKSCKNYRMRKPPGVSFHQFPRNKWYQSLWLEALGMEKENFSWSVNKVVCSNHFQKQDFIEFPGKRALRKMAVPSINLQNTEPPQFVVPDMQAGPSGIQKNKSSDMSYLTDISNISTGASEAAAQSLTRKKKTAKMYKKKSSSDNISSSTSSGGYQKNTRKRTLSSNAKGIESGTSTDSSTKRRRLHVKTFHNYSTSPTTVKVKNMQLRKRQEAYRKKLYSATKKINYLKKNVTSLKEVISSLKSQEYLSDHASSHISRSFDSIPSLLMNRYLKNFNNETVTHESYPEPLREFAATLQFYSCKAYEYVRSQFSLALPHQATIRKWTSNIEANPGFINAAFHVLQEKSNEASQNGRELICSMMLDEMSIKKQIEFDGKRTVGYVDIGVPIDNDLLPPASEALVIMVVSHQSHWKLPIAYFLIKSLNGKEKANLVQEALIRLNEVGVTITSITCDGPSAHFSMLSELGCNIENINSLKPWFPHPVNPTEPVFCFLDACHMLKLIRNHFATLQQFKDPSGKIVNWNYITKLYKVYEETSLYVANKVRAAHIQWHKQKMKVHLAAQTLSESVAAAIEFLDKDCALPEFKDSEATIQFIRIIDRLFDVLNSKSPWAKHYKAPIQIDNEQFWRPFLMEAVNYLSQCTDVSGRPLWLTPKKTPFLGFAISIWSACGIFDNYVKTGRLRYLLTYKCSQDHLEIFFSSIRCRNGWNNNPTALQFIRTFKKLLLHTKISPKGGNCKVMDTTTVLTVSSNYRQGSKELLPSEECIDISFCKKYSIDPMDLALQDHDYDVLPCFIGLDNVSSNIVTYIAGYVVTMLKKKIKCLDCLMNCTSSMETVEADFNYRLINKKNKGGLQVPSPGIVKICENVEVNIRNLLLVTDNRIPIEEDFLTKFVVAVGQKFFNLIPNLFPDLIDHSVLLPNEENHSFRLVKEIILAYTKIRLYNLAKKFTAKIQGSLVRRELNKLILFNHQ